MPERSHGKMRPSLPRLGDVPPADAVGEPSGTRDAHGRFAPGNQSGAGRGWKHRIAEQLGRSLGGPAGELGREAYSMFRSFMQDVPCDSASVRALVAQRARAVVLAAHYGRLAADAGLGTEDGMRASQEALKWDARAERLAVTSLDVSVRQAKAASSKPIDAHGEVFARFGRKDT